MRTLAFIFHHHQPCGNLPEMFEQAYQQAYVPLLDLIERLAIPVTLHYSGALLDWFAQQHPDFLRRLKDLAQQGRVELLGGAMYEPILSIIPDQDKLAQIRYHADQIEALSVRPQGMWLAERVWEPHFPAILDEAGMRYTFLDDTQFISAGFEADQLYKGFLTEENGRVIEIYPMHTSLMPMPEESPENYVARLQAVEGLIVLGHEGEKCGLWPDSYPAGWLESVFGLLFNNPEFELTTPSQHRIAHPPRTHAYLPSSAYAEMGKYTGGFWRNYLVKYPEVAAMQKRMVYVSQKVSQKGRTSLAAQQHLWRAQTGDAYWHSTYGGVYHNFLRFEVYRNLIEAENLIEPHKYSWLEVEYHDIDADGAKEVIAESNTMNLHFKPRSGGMLTEWDFRPRAMNLTDSFTRRREPYHPEGLIYDRYPRRSLIDHFVAGDLTLEQFANNDFWELGDFVTGDFQPSKYRNRVNLSRMGTVRGPGGQPVPVELKKSVRIMPKENRLDVEYKVTNHGIWDIITRFGSEWNFGLLAAHTPNRYYVVNGQQTQDLSGTEEHRNVSHFSLVDEWARLRIDFEFEGREALMWYYPIKAVMLDPQGQLVSSYQSSVIMPLWDLDLPKGRSRRMAYSISVHEI